MKIGVVGAGAMGSGIAQIAAQNGHEVCLNDTNLPAVSRAKLGHQKIFTRLIEKGRMKEGEDKEIIDRVCYTKDLNDLRNCDLIIEAVIEDLEVKKTIFKKLQYITQDDAILASNTSSLSIASISSLLDNPSRALGIHFFNPAPLMPLVEIIPAVTTDSEVVERARKVIDSWGKVTVVAKDTPGFIVNRVARPFYGEALRIYEEGMADFATIDWAMTELGGFRMGPFTLMDFIGNDINYAVTESVFEAFYYDPRYKPSFTQKRMVEAGWLGKKANRGYYDYSYEAAKPQPNTDKENGQKILNRIVAMLINEAADAVYLNIATKEDVDLAMTKGVNYPKGLLKWADEIGIDKVVAQMDELHDYYREDRYRCSPILRNMLRDGKRFYR